MKEQVIKRITPLFQYLGKEFSYQPLCVNCLEHIARDFDELFTRLFKESYNESTLKDVKQAHGILIEYRNLSDCFYYKLVKKKKKLEEVFKKYMDVDRIQAEYDEDMKSELFNPDFEEPLLFWNFVEAKPYKAVWLFKERKFELQEPKFEL